MPIAQPKSPHRSAAPSARITELVKPSRTRGLFTVAVKFAAVRFSSVNGTPGAGSSARYASPSSGPRVSASASTHEITDTGHLAPPSASLSVPFPLMLDDARLETR